MGNSMKTYKEKGFLDQYEPQIFDKSVLFEEGKIVVKKESERERDRFIDRQLKQARKLFHTKKSFEQLQTELIRRQRECLPLKQLMDQKLNSLKVIHIQYGFTKTMHSIDKFRYSISAFDLFKLIHQNKLLTEVLIRGVFVDKFQQFIQLMNPSNSGLLAQNQGKQDFNWMKVFAPSKDLKLTINTKIQFDVSQRDRLIYLLDDFSHFISLFDWISDIKILIKLCYNDMMMLDKVWRALTKLKNIKMEIQGNGYKEDLPEECIGAVRCGLFGWLSSFTEIVQLAFNGISFGRKNAVNDRLAMQQSLKIFFDNNKVTHLKMQACSNFPAFPEIACLQSIELDTIYPWEQNAFISRVTQSKSMKSIKCCSMIPLGWQIQDELFDKLQNLDISFCQDIRLKSIEPKIPSNIKHLELLGNNFFVNDVNVGLSKLEHLITLNIWGYYDYQAIGAIPSPHLEELSLMSNGLITNECIRKIDAKWPNLRALMMNFCDNINQKVWSMCEFKGLMVLSISRAFLGQRQSATSKLIRNKGIKLRSF